MRKGIKRVQLQKSRLPRRHYREDIPDDCRDCSFWLKGIDNYSRYCRSPVARSMSCRRNAICWSYRLGSRMS
jgi:hypothetical protein